jgi:2-oxoglutarate dehydrogenase E2 component (dihydrolipoamide succinyltransferase)
MPTDVVMPQMGESIFEGTITKWLKKPGDTVKRDEPLFEISTDKVDAEIPSPESGVLREIKHKEGETVKVNTVVAVLDAEGAGAAAAPAAPAPKPAAAPVTPAPSAAQPAAPAAAPAAPAPQAIAPAAQPATQQTPAPTSQADGAATEVVMPQMGESIFEGTITKWLKKPGEQVRRDEPLFEISTDKVDAEIPAPASGVLSEIRAQTGETVKVNAVVAVIGGAGQTAAPAKPAAQPATPPAASIATAAPQPAAPASVTPAAPQPAPPAAEPHEVIEFPHAEDEGERVRSSPLVRKIAKEYDVKVAQVRGTGMGGRVTKEDIQKFIEARGIPSQRPAAAASSTSPAISQPVQAPSPPAYQAGAAVPAQPVPAPAAQRGAIEVPGEVVPMSAMRKKIAERMVESKRTSAHVHSVFAVDMSRVIAVRQKEKNDYERRTGTRLTMMPFFCRAAIEAMRAYPIINASVEGDNIRYHRNVNLGIAVALDWGLIVPVIKHAEELNFLGIQRAILDLADRARSKKLKPDEVAGGTFTITNPGQYGQMFGLPIIMQPQVAILGVGSVKKEPVVVTDENGQDSIAIRSIGHISLGYDHRVVDGAVADQFLRDTAKYLENWNEPLG